MVIDENAIQMIIKSNYSYMEQIAALNKRLHFKIFPEARGKWLFTKIQVNDYIDPQLFKDHLLTIKAGKHLHFKLTKNLIYLDDMHIGQIWFSLQI
jgi:hypothetical protein